MDSNVEIPDLDTVQQDLRKTEASLKMVKTKNESLRKIKAGLAVKTTDLEQKCANLEALRAFYQNKYEVKAKKLRQMEVKMRQLEVNRAAFINADHVILIPEEVYQEADIVMEIKDLEARAAELREAVRMRCLRNRVQLEEYFVQKSDDKK